MRLFLCKYIYLCLHDYIFIVRFYACVFITMHKFTMFNQSTVTQLNIYAHITYALFRIYTKIPHGKVCRGYYCGYRGKSTVKGKKFAFTAVTVNIFKRGNYRGKFAVNILYATIVYNIIVIFMFLVILIYCIACIIRSNLSI